MVKIIRPKSRFIKTVVCDNCYNELEYTVEDVKEENVVICDAYDHTYWYITCPACILRVKIPETKKFHYS